VPLQCFNTVGSVTGRAFQLKKHPALAVPKGSPLETWLVLKFSENGVVKTKTEGSSSSHRMTLRASRNLHTADSSSLGIRLLV